MKLSSEKLGARCALVIAIIALSLGIYIAWEIRIFEEFETWLGW